MNGHNGLPANLNLAQDRELAQQAEVPDDSHEEIKLLRARILELEAILEALRLEFGTSETMD